MSDSKNPLKRWFRRGKIPNEKNCPGYVPELTKTINKIKKCLVYNDWKMTVLKEENYAV